MLRLAIDRSLRYGRFTGGFIVAKQTVKQTAQLFCPWTSKTLREDNSDALESP